MWHPTPYVATWLPRLITRWLPGMLTRLPGPENEKRFFLTFDDGPSPLTGSLLDVLRSYNVRATFFLSGKQASTYPRWVKCIVDEGHTLGNHGWEHKDPWRMSWKALRHSFVQTEEFLQRFTDRQLPLRPPYGHLTPSLLRWCNQTSRHLVLWDIMPADFLPSMDVHDLYTFTVRHLRNGSIIVLHDSPQAGLRPHQLLHHLLPHCLEQGWKCETL